MTEDNPRAAAARRNGARSKGPRTAEGKARSSKNALKHGLRASRHVVLADEDADAYAELEAALIEELAPEGALQARLVQRIAAAEWRLERAERMECQLLDRNLRDCHGRIGHDLALALYRDGNQGGGLSVLLRYRSAARAEMHKALAELRLLKAEARIARAERAAEKRPKGDGVSAERTRRPRFPLAIRDPMEALSAALFGDDAELELLTAPRPGRAPA